MCVNLQAMIEILLITKGHPFERAPFFSVFDEMDGVSYTHVEQPAAQALFDPRYAEPFDAFVLYDMPGVRFDQPAFPEPPDHLRRNLRALTEAGKGLVFLHHAIAGWPAWPEYGDLIGGRFLYLPTSSAQDSGYRHGVTHTVSVVADHPVTQDLPRAFSMTDELYLAEVFDDVEPLLRSDYEFVAENFYSAAKVVREGKMHDNDGWAHAPGSNLIGWTRREDASRIVYLQPGDDPVAYANPHFRRLIANAIGWVAGRS